MKVLVLVAILFCSCAHYPHKHRRITRNTAARVDYESAFIKSLQQP